MTALAAESDAVRAARARRRHHNTLVPRTRRVQPLWWHGTDAAGRSQSGPRHDDLPLALDGVVAFVEARRDEGWRTVTVLEGGLYVLAVVRNGRIWLATEVWS